VCSLLSFLVPCLLSENNCKLKVEKSLKKVSERHFLKRLLNFQTSVFFAFVCTEGHTRRETRRFSLRRRLCASAFGAEMQNSPSLLCADAPKVQALISQALKKSYKDDTRVRLRRSPRDLSRRVSSPSAKR